MRMHIELEDALVAKVDGIAGPRGRSSFVRLAVERAVEQEQRRAELRSAAGTIADHSHEWDADVAGWVRLNRRTDGRRAG